MSFYSRYTGIFNSDLVCGSLGKSVRDESEYACRVVWMGREVTMVRQLFPWLLSHSLFSATIMIVSDRSSLRSSMVSSYPIHCQERTRRIRTMPKIRNEHSIGNRHVYCTYVETVPVRISLFEGAERWVTSSINRFVVCDCVTFTIITLSLRFNEKVQYSMIAFAIARADLHTVIKDLDIIEWKN